MKVRCYWVSPVVREEYVGGVQFRVRKGFFILLRFLAMLRMLRCMGKLLVWVVALG